MTARILLSLIFLSATTAPGAVVVSEGLQAVGFGAPTASVDFNLDGVPEVVFSHDGITAYAHSGNGARLQAVPATPPNLGSWAAPVLAGEMIGQVPSVGTQWLVEVLGSAIYGTASTGVGASVSYGLWPPSTLVYFDPVNFFLLPVTTAFLGVQFDVAGQIHYGWIEIGVIKDVPNAYIFGSAWDTTPNTPIVAGVPEPGRGVLMLSSGLWLMLRRRRAALGAG